MTAAPALKLHAVMLGVTDVDASAAFYGDRLGFAPCGRVENFAFFESQGATFVLSGPLGRARPPREPQSVEIVLAVESVRDAYDQLSARGVAFLNEPHMLDGVNHVANFEDPDGHVFSLYGAP